MGVCGTQSICSWGRVQRCWASESGLLPDLQRAYEAFAPDSAGGDAEDVRSHESRALLRTVEYRKALWSPARSFRIGTFGPTGARLFGRAMLLPLALGGACAGVRVNRPNRDASAPTVPLACRSVMHWWTF
jgi:hypothetical protein